MLDQKADPVVELLDKQAVHEVMLRYLRGVDRLDPDLIQSAYHPDAEDDHGGKFFSGAGIGEAIVPLVAELFASTVHLLGNHLVDLQGDVAYSESYVLGYYTAVDEQGDYILVRALRYVDELVKTAGEWKIKRRRLIREWDRIDRNQERPPDRAYIEPRRSRADISYDRAGDEVTVGARA